MPRTLRRESGASGRADAPLAPRTSLAERLERAREASGRELGRVASAEKLERMRREGFASSPLLREHEDELLAITGELAHALPVRAEYCARTGEGVGWEGGPAGETAALKAHALLENPACTFVWEVKNNPHGMLSASSNREYNWALENTDAICDLWENNPAASEAELAKALIVQTVLRDDDLRAEVLGRAAKLARTASGTLGPYFADWKR